jgi:hypothetical protein
MSTTLRICAFAQQAPPGCGKVAEAWIAEDGRMVLRRICTFCPDQLRLAAAWRRADAQDLPAPQSVGGAETG